MGCASSNPLVEGGKNLMDNAKHATDNVIGMGEKAMNGKSTNVTKTNKTLTTINQLDTKIVIFMHVLNLLSFFATKVMSLYELVEQIQKLM